MLLVDSREPAALRRAITAALGPESIVTVKLDSADFLLFDQDGLAVGIERKTIADFLASITTVMASGDGRLTSQLDRMDDTYPARILLLEGGYGISPRGNLIVGKRESAWKHAAFQMILLALQRRRSFFLLHTPDHEGTVDALRVLHTHVTTRSFAASGTMSRTDRTPRTEERPDAVDVRAPAGAVHHRHRAAHPRRAAPHSGAVE